MFDNKLGGFQSKKDIDKILRHHLSEKRYRMLENQELIIPPKAEEVLNDLFLKRDEITGFIKKEVEKTYHELSEKGFTHYGSAPSTKHIISALVGIIGTVKYEEFQKITDMTGVDTFLKGIEIITKGSGQKPSSNRDQHIKDMINSNPGKLLGCFKDEIKEEIKHEIFREALSYFNFIPRKVVLKVIEDPNFRKGLTTAKYATSLFLIQLIKRIEKRKCIRVLKEDNDLWKILGIPRRSYQEKSKEVETIFGTIFDELVL